MDDSERPGPDADASVIAEWMDDDFGRALADGVENAKGKTSRRSSRLSITSGVRS